jgi:midasin (ATPase involved in ribosome maturation)
LIIIQGLNQVDGSVSESLNGILEVGKGRQLTINDEVVHLSDNVMIIATTSLGTLGSNCGMSPALLSRFISFRHY